MAPEASRRRDLTLALALVLVTAAVYAEVRHHDFVNYDDPAYVTDNPRVRQGLTWEGVRWAAGAITAANWHPLTWLSHMADVDLFGLDPGAHHLVNLLFHLLNTLLVFEVVRRMTGAAWRSAFVAALFALHPLHVESVAWVAERKDVLSTFFGLLALRAYASYAERPSAGRYAGVLLPFTLGLLAKPMLVTLPCVLLLLDSWPLGRAWRKLVLIEKVPLFLLALGSSAITFAAQRAGGTVLPLHAMPLGARAANAAVSYVTYLGKTIWPSVLAVAYPYPAVLPVWKVGLAVLALAAISWLAVAQRRRRPYLLVGWLWYLVTLLPVIGIVQVGDQALADRYTYMPLLGIFIAIAWGVPDLLGAWRPGRQALAAAAAAVLVALSARTARQVPVWHDTVSLFRNAVRVTTGNYVAGTYLGAALREAGDLDEALALLEAVDEMGVAFPDAPYTLGQIHEARGDAERAAVFYRRALGMQPDHAGALLNLGNWLERHGRSEEALAHYRNALRLLPRHPAQYNNLGVLLTRLGRPAEALAPLERALALEPENVEALNNLGVAHLDLGHLEEAATYFTRALRLEPRHRLARYNLGVASQRAGRLAEAVAHFEQALVLDPQSAETFVALGDTRAKMGDPEKAREAFERALLLDPQAAGVRDKLELMTRYRGR